MDEVISGELRAKAESPRAVVLRREDLNQLVLELTGRHPSAPLGRSFGELSKDWLSRMQKIRVCPENERRQVQHMQRLHELREGTLTKVAIEELFGQLLRPSGTLGATTVNKLRGAGRLIVRDAQGNNEWRGPNPFELVRRYRGPKRLYLTLTLDEVLRVLPKLRKDRRCLVKTVVLVGLRPGEALGLLKVDVDLERRVMIIRRSHRRDQTKTGRERRFPIPAELVEDIRTAIEDSPTELVFPKLDGSHQRADTKLAMILRNALGAAGVVQGYRYRCRNKACGFDETRTSLELHLDCPTCGFRLRPKAVPKPLRFYDLRHTCATLHREAGCDPLVIQQLLGHASNLTDGTYTHLSEEYVRGELSKLSLACAGSG